MASEQTAEQAVRVAQAGPNQAPDAGDVDIMKDIDVSKLDWSLLDTDLWPLTGPEPKKSAAASSAEAPEATWSSSDRPNGTSAVSVSQSITPFWDTRIGADMTVARQGTEPSGARSISEAQVPVLPIAPSPYMFLLLGLVAAAALSGAAVVVNELRRAE